MIQNEARHLGVNSVLDEMKLTGKAAVAALCEGGSERCEPVAEAAVASVEEWQARARQGRLKVEIDASIDIGSDAAILVYHMRTRF